MVIDLKFERELYKDFVKSMIDEHEVNLWDKEDISERFNYMYEIIIQNEHDYNCVISASLIKKMMKCIYEIQI